MNPVQLIIALLYFPVSSSFTPSLNLPSAVLPLLQSCSNIPCSKIPSHFFAARFRRSKISPNHALFAPNRALFASDIATLDDSGSSDERGKVYHDKLSHLSDEIPDEILNKPSFDVTSTLLSINITSSLLHSLLLPKKVGKLRDDRVGGVVELLVKQHGREEAREIVVNNPSILLTKGEEGGGGEVYVCRSGVYFVRLCVSLGCVWRPVVCVARVCVSLRYVCFVQQLRA